MNIEDLKRLQIEPDWRKGYSNRQQVELDLEGFEWCGPGLYLSDTDTLLVIDRRVIEVYVFNVEYSRTILGVTNIPIVCDRRSDLLYDG